MDSFQQSAVDELGLSSYSLYGLEAERLQPWRAFQRAVWWGEMVEAYLAGLPDARRLAETILMQDMLPQLALRDGGEGSGGSGGSATSSSYSYASSNRDSVDDDEGREASGSMRLILELSIAILTSALAANPARIFVIDDGALFRLFSIFWYAI